MSRDVRKTNVQAEKILYFTRTSGSQHVPSTNMFHDFVTGVHWTQGKRALSPIAMFPVIIMNHTSTFCHPWVKRSRVTAKLVFDHMAAVTEKVPATVTRRSRRPIFQRSKSQIWRPYPKPVIIDRSEHSMVMQT
jgi:hypothetical protein